MSDEKGVSTSQALGGAFGGEMKYFILLMSLATVGLFGGLVLTVQIAGVQSLVSGLAFIVGLVFVFIIFFVGWILIWVILYTKTSQNHSYEVIVRPENFKWPTLVQDEKTTQEIDPVTGKPTGWRNKRFILYEPTEYNPRYHQFGLVNEYIVHYYGEWQNLSGLKPGFATYKDMDMPNNSTEIITVEPIELAYLNVKHGAKVPVFRLIGGRYEGKYFDPEKIIPNPDTNQITIKQGLSIAASTPNLSLTQEQANKTIRELRLALAERQRQSEEDKSDAIKHQQIHDLDYGEMGGIKDLTGQMHNITVSTCQHVVTAMNSWEDGLRWLQGEKFSKTFWLAAAIIICFIGGLVFLSINPDLMADVTQAFNNPLVSLAVIAVAAAAVFIVYYTRKKRRKR